MQTVWLGEPGDEDEREVSVEGQYEEEQSVEYEEEPEQELLVEEPVDTQD